MLRKGMVFLVNTYKEEFEHLYSENYHKVYNLALGLTGNPDEAEEITQEAFYRALKSYGSFRHDSSFFTWIYRITLNVSNNYLKRKKNLPTQYLEDELEKLGLRVENIIDSNPAENDPETLYLARETRFKCLHSLTECLTGEQRKIFCMVITLGLSHKQVAEILGCSLNKVKTTLHRAKKRWFGYMNNRCSLIKKSNPCKCEQWVCFALKHGWITKEETSIKKQAVNTHALQEAKKLKNLKELYQTLYPDSADQALKERIREGIKKKEWQILS